MITTMGGSEESVAKDRLKVSSMGVDPDCI